MLNENIFVIEACGAKLHSDMSYKFYITYDAVEVYMDGKHLTNIDFEYRQQVIDNDLNYEYKCVYSLPLELSKSQLLN